MKKPLALPCSAAVAALAAALLAGCAATPPGPATLTRNQRGEQGGYFYSFWTDSPGSVSMTLGAAGRYGVTWDSPTGNFTAGKGWATGGRRVIAFDGRFDGGSNGYLAIYGWTTHPLVEYYIVENHGDWQPPGAVEPIGTFDSDGGTYKIYKTLRVNQPSILGTATFEQYWSVRTTKRSSGQVTTGNHFDAWAKLGLELGDFDYMILETEGYHSRGSADLTVR
ncbi:MAG: glycoside hydrolase family 11 protein [Pelomonas sp.]|nr:glycoside hydrolase family 11 protein [Roseateles sp.]